MTVGFRAPQVDLNDPGWRARAECLWHDPEIWYPVAHGRAVTPQVKAAKLLCHGCPVEAECRTWALDTDEPYGVWGGLSEEERLEIRKAKRREALARQGVAS